MESIVFGHPITHFSFFYNGKKEVYALNEMNYKYLHDLMVKTGRI